MPREGALYECVDCAYKWVGTCGPIQADDTLTQCRRCRHPYLRWLNYEEMFVARR